MWAMCNNYLGSHDGKIALIWPFYEWTTLSVKNLMPLKPATVAYSSHKSSLLSNVDQTLLLSHITESQIHEVMVINTSQSINAHSRRMSHSQQKKEMTIENRQGNIYLFINRYCGFTSNSIQ